MSDPSTSGRCLCGGVRFELTEPARAAGYCHCTRCQRRTGTAASAQARIDGRTLRLLQGEDLVKVWRPLVTPSRVEVITSRRALVYLTRSAQTTARSRPGRAYGQSSCSASAAGPSSISSLR